VAAFVGRYDLSPTWLLIRNGRDSAAWSITFREGYSDIGEATHESARLL